VNNKATASVLVSLLAAAIGVVAVETGLHGDPISRLNTRYASGYSSRRLNEIAPGDSIDRVLKILGEPLHRGFTVYRDEGGAVPVEGVQSRSQLPLGARIYGEFLHYSEAKNAQRDYHLIWIHIGEDNRVFAKFDWITD
jgi:hypothetical protein